MRRDAVARLHGAPCELGRVMTRAARRTLQGTSARIRRRWLEGKDAGMSTKPRSWTVSAMGPAYPRGANNGRGERSRAHGPLPVRAPTGCAQPAVLGDGTDAEARSGAERTVERMAGLPSEQSERVVAVEVSNERLRFRM